MRRTYTTTTTKHTMKCYQCNNEVPAGYPQCPFCGAPQQQMGGQGINVNVYQAAPNYPPKSRMTYILLALFLGGFGIHNFYAGYSGKGIAQLLISCLTCGVGAIAVFIWVIIEMCTVDKDANGVPMT